MSLTNFVQDTHTFKEVFDYMNSQIDEYALKQIYNGADVSGIKDAKEIIATIQRKMEVEFKIKKENKIQNKAL